MDTVYLTSAERSLFDALPDSVRNGWQIAEETLTVAESPAQRRMRLHLLQLRDPKLKNFITEAQGKNSVDELATFVLSMDLKGVSEADLAELFFALGPTALTLIIADSLKKVKTDDDLDGINALVTIRHSLLLSMQPIP